MVYTFACTIAHFIDDDWNLIERVVDFKPLADKEHEGKEGGHAFVNGARARGGLDKMSVMLFCLINLDLSEVRTYFISMTTDNASVNDVIVQTAARCLLERYDIPPTDDMHIRCIAHVINLVVQAFLAALDEAPDPDIHDLFDDAQDFPLHYDVGVDDAQIELEAEVINEDELMDDDELLHIFEDDLDSLSKESALKRVSSSDFCLINVLNKL